MNTILSVIVPVYQAEKFIDRCINSILSSTYHNLELVLVDDGSTDQSAAICDTWAAKDKRVRVVHKVNGGVSSARNEGILTAKGKYVTFVDADDYISKDTYEIALNHFSEEVCSVAYKVVICDSSGIPLNHNSTSGDTLVFDTPIKALEYYWYEGKNTAVWCRIFLRDIITQNGILFDTATCINEEGLFMTNYYAHCSGKVVQLNNRLYYYVQNSQSASHNVTGSQIKKLIENYHSLIPICASLSASCNEKIKLRYVEVLIHLKGNHYLKKQLDASIKRLIKVEIKQNLKLYLASKLVSKRRKYYTLVVLWLPMLPLCFQKSLKLYLHKSGKTW